ncbi:hypothetical protein SLS59_000919 [Nothophoma quercina]|uniref:Uncharacterized protein n=1 Tax=Nothophoma quercina TaxID=749835 RepID=A0ABR3S4A6_9PLEO
MAAVGNSVAACRKGELEQLRETLKALESIGPSPQVPTQLSPDDSNEAFALQPFDSNQPVTIGSMQSEVEYKSTHSFDMEDVLNNEQLEAVANAMDLNGLDWTWAAKAGMLEMKETITGLILEVVAGVIEITAKCENGTVKTMAFENVLAFVYTLDHKANIPGLQVVSVDVALGGMHYVLVDAVSVDLAIKHKHGPELVPLGALINAAVIESLEPVHLENNKMRGVTILEWTKPLQTGAKGIKVPKNPIV